MGQFNYNYKKLIKVTFHSIIQSITRITQAWDNVTLLIDFGIQSGRENFHIGVALQDGSHAGLRGTHGEDMDDGHTEVLEHVDGGNGRTACGDHWIQNVANVKGVCLRKLIVILDGLQGSLFAKYSNMDKGSSWNQLKQGYDG